MQEGTSGRERRELKQGIDQQGIDQQWIMGKGNKSIDTERCENIDTLYIGVNKILSSILLKWNFIAVHFK